MQCSAFSTKIRKRWCFPDQLLSHFFSCTVEALDFPEESPHFESNAQIRSQNPNYYLPPPLIPNPHRIVPHPTIHQSLESSQFRVRLKMQERAKLGDLEEALDALKLLKPNILDYNALLHCYLKSGNVSINKLVDIFEGMKRFGPHPNIWTFNILFNGLCSLGFLKDAFFIVEEMCINRFVPSFSSLMRLMKNSLSSGIFELSLKVLVLMLRFGYTPTPPVLNTLIYSLSRANRIHEAYHIFSVILGKGFIPNVYTYNSILFGLCRSGQSYTALSLFYSLRKRGFVHNVYSYTSLVLGFSKEGLWEEAYQVLEQMQSDGYMPTVITYTVLIKFLCKYKKVEEALGILEKMSKEGCHPDLVTYNVLLNALCCHNRLIDARELIRVMEEKGFFPDQFTHCALAAGLLKAGHVKKSQDLLLKVFSGNVVDVITWNVYLHNLCQDNKVKEAKSMVSCMMEKGFVPNNVTCNTVLKGLCMEKNIDEALEFLDHFDWGKNGPDLISFNTLLSAASKHGNSSMIRRVLDRMDIEGAELNVVSMTCLIQYFGKVGKFLDCFKLFKYMICAGHCPTTVTFNVLLDILCKEGLLEIAYGLFNKFKTKGAFLDTTSYNILIHASIRNTDYFSVKCLLMDMYCRGLVPDAITYGSLCYGLCKVKSINAALQLEGWMVEHGVQPSIYYYNNILDAMFRIGRLWDVFLILVKMEIEGIEQDAVSFNIFNHAMSTGGRKRFSKAMKVLEILMNRGEIKSTVESG